MLRSLQCFTHPHQFGWLRRRYLQSAIRRSLLGADLVVAGSSASADDALRLLGLDPTRLRVIPHGLAPHIASALDKPLPARQTQRPYLLAVSTLYGHKNYPRLLQAFASLRRRNAIPHELQIAGADADLTAADLRRMAEETGRRRRRQAPRPGPPRPHRSPVPAGRRPGLRLPRRDLRPPAPRSHGPRLPRHRLQHDLPARNHRRRGRACRPDRRAGHRLSHRTRRHPAAAPRRAWWLAAATARPRLHLAPHRRTTAGGP